MGKPCKIAGDSVEEIIRSRTEEETISICHPCESLSSLRKLVIPAKALSSLRKLVIPAKAGISFAYMYYVYILASRRNGALYVGVTSDLIKRVYEHKNNLVEGFTNKYNVHNLVYFESFDNIEDAIVREKRIEKWKRSWKIELIEKNNCEWKDLYNEIT